ncbi:MAG: hypothetical protein ABH829_01445 [archaeon]
MKEGVNKTASKNVTVIFPKEIPYLEKKFVEFNRKVCYRALESLEKIRFYEYEFTWHENGEKHFCVPFCPECCASYRAGKTYKIERDWEIGMKTVRNCLGGRDEEKGFRDADGYPEGFAATTKGKIAPYALSKLFVFMNLAMNDCKGNYQELREKGYNKTYAHFDICPYFYGFCMTHNEKFFDCGVKCLRRYTDARGFTRDLHMQLEGEFNKHWKKKMRESLESLRDADTVPGIISRRFEFIELANKWDKEFQKIVSKELR